jgi:hypothetical protein
MLAYVLLCLPALAQETLRQYLSGHGNDDGVPWQFICNGGRNANNWATIPVPSNWELQGFGTFTYGVEIGKKPMTAVQGRYKHTFKVPDDWSGRNVFIVFEGVMTDTQVQVNGHSAGPLHQGGYYQFRYDITKLVKCGHENLLEVTVDDESANASINHAERRGDYWNYAGIYRPVYLEAMPQEFIEHVAIDARADGSFAMDVATQNVATADTVEAQIIDAAGKPAGEALRANVTGDTTSARLTAKISAPALWTAETPNLYQVEVRLKHGATVLHQMRQRFGFRTIEVRRGEGIFVNGKRVLLKGCCRHSFWPDSGRCTSEKISRDDIKLMQDMNMNAVRMSHYPPDQHFLEACDEMGLYVLDELAGWQHAYDSTVGHGLVQAMVQRDVNHPSILIWDNGNEGGWNKDADDDFAKWDPQQRVVNHPWAKFRDINDPHYPNYASLLKGCMGDAAEVYLPTEFLHGLYDGGLGAGLQDFWDVMRKSKVAGGGFLWAFLDEAVKRVDLDGQLDHRGNLAPDGIVGPYREKEGSYYAIKHIWLPVVVTEEKLPEKFDGKLTIENRYSFIDARQCAFAWQLRKYPRAGDDKTEFATVAQGMAKVDSPIPPGGTGMIQLDLPADWGNAEALSLCISDPKKRELWTYVWPLSHVNDYRALAVAPSEQKTSASETADAITLHAADLGVVINKETGMLDSVTRGGKAFSLSNGPRPVPGSATPATIEQHADGADQVVNVAFTGSMKSIQWRLRGNGWLQVDYAYTAEGPQDFFGVGFSYPEAKVKAMKWLGEGPYRAWKNRLAAGTFGLWQNTYNDTMTGDQLWKYPEFKGFYADVRWLQLQTTEGPITVSLGDDNLYMQVLTPRWQSPKEAKGTAMTFPSADISILHAIPAIGSKFMGPEKQGPLGQKNIATGEYHASVSLYFGPLK